MNVGKLSDIQGSKWLKIFFNTGISPIESNSKSSSTCWISQQRHQTKVLWLPGFGPIWKCATF